MLSDDIFRSIRRFTCRAPDGQDLRVLLASKLVVFLSRVYGGENDCCGRKNEVDGKHESMQSVEQGVALGVTRLSRPDDLHYYTNCVHALHRWCTFKQKPILQAQQC